MDSVNAIELLGYLASGLVAVSLMMRSLHKLRIINMIGAFLFTLYGFFIGAYPVAVLNGFIVLVNIYYLQQVVKPNAT